MLRSGCSVSFIVFVSLRVRKSSWISARCSKREGYGLDEKSYEARYTVNKVFELLVDFVFPRKQPLNDPSDNDAFTFCL